MLSSPPIDKNFVCVCTCIWFAFFFRFLLRSDKTFKLINLKGRFVMFVEGSVL